MSGFGALYRVGVGINLKDGTTAGLRKMVGEIKATAKEAERLKKQIGDISSRFGGAKNLDDAKRKMADLAKFEADVRTKAATAQRTQDANRYRRQLQSIDLTKKQLNAQMQGFRIEQTSIDRQAKADAEKERRDQRKIARDTKAQREATAYLRFEDKQQAATQQRAERAAAKETRDAAVKAKQAQAYSAWWSGALDRKDRAAQREDERTQRKHASEERTRQRETIRNQRKMKEQRKRAGEAISSGSTSAAVAGGAVLGGLVYSTEQAAQYQQTSIEALMPLGYARWNPKQQQKHLREIQSAASAASSATGYFSEQQIMQGMQSIATNGANQLGIDTFLKLTPAIAQYMDVVGRLKNENPTEAAGQAMEYAHMVGATTPAQLTKALNSAASLSLITGHDMGTALSTLQYLQPVAHLLGKQGPIPSLALYASLDQSGQGGGHVGARTKDLIEAFTTQGTIGSAKKPGSEYYRELLGFKNARNADGSLDSVKMIQTLIDDAKKFNKIDPKTKLNEFSTYIMKAVGQQALPTALFLADPSGNGLRRFLNNQKYIQDATNRGDLGVVQGVLKNTAVGSQKSAQTQMQNLVIEFGKTGVPIMEKFFKTAISQLQAINRFMDAHPRFSDQLFNGLLAFSEMALMFKAIVWPIEQAIIAFKGIRAIAMFLASFGPRLAVMAETMGPISEAVAVLAVAITAFPIATTIAIGAAIVGLVEAIIHAGDLINIARNIKNTVKNAAAPLNKATHGRIGAGARIIPDILNMNPLQAFKDANTLLHGDPAAQSHKSEVHVHGGVSINVNVNGKSNTETGKAIADAARQSILSVAFRSGSSPTNGPTVSRLAFGHAAGAV